MMLPDPDERLSRALRQLPIITAPVTLLPRVIAAVQVWAGRPWYQRAWFTWPGAWQFATVGTLLLVVGAALAFLPGVETLRSAAVAALSSGRPVVNPDSLARIEALWLAARVLWQGFQSVLAYAFFIVAVMTAMCLTVAVTLNRAVFGRM